MSAAETQTGQLVRYDAMCHAIDAAYKFDEVKDIRDKAAMLEAAARVAGNTQAEDRCYEIRRRAEAKAAKLYDEQEKAKPPKGNQYTGKMVRSNEPTEPKTLADLGTTKQEMAEWRKLAAVPKKQFDAAFAEGGKPSIAEITGKKKIERSAEWNAGLWVCGRILDFERNDLLKLSAKQCVKEMDSNQIEVVARLGPKVIAWLGSVVKLAKESADG